MVNSIQFLKHCHTLQSMRPIFKISMWVIVCTIRCNHATALPLHVCGLGTLLPKIWSMVCAAKMALYSKVTLYSSNKLSFWHSTIALYYPAVHLVLGMQFHIIFFACWCGTELGRYSWEVTFKDTFTVSNWVRRQLCFCWCTGFCSGLSGKVTHLVQRLIMLSCESD